jgi:hypothetical protein
MAGVLEGHRLRLARLCLEMAMPNQTNPVRETFQLVSTNYHTATHVTVFTSQFVTLFFAPVSRFFVLTSQNSFCCGAGCFYSG